MRPEAGSNPPGASSARPQSGAIPSEGRVPLAWGFLYAACAGGLFFGAVWVGSAALGPSEHHRIWITGLALACYVPAVLLTVSAGWAVRGSASYKRVAAGSGAVCALSVAALACVLPAFLEAAGAQGRAFGGPGSVPLTALAAGALAIGLSWLMARAVWLGTLAATSGALALVGAALAIPPAA